MSLLHILVLAIIQGLAELLPVSSSAHVIVAETLMGIDPSSAEMTFLLVMLHTGTMFAVLLFFWKRWRKIWRAPTEIRRTFVKGLLFATAVTGVVGLILKKVIERIFLGDSPHSEIEQLFGNLPLIAGSLFAVGILIFIAGSRAGRPGPLTDRKSILIGVVQGLCLPFRGFSRSGATISTGLLAGVSKDLSEEFSFALAVILTPPVVARELLRLVKAHEGAAMSALVGPGLAGMAFSFAAGLVALKWVSSWIEGGRWKWFAYYCWAASVGVLLVRHLS